MTVCFEMLHGRREKFQSLFWWILYCDYRYYITKIMKGEVSILVLVDLIL